MWCASLGYVRVSDHLAIKNKHGKISIMTDVVTYEFEVTDVLPKVPNRRRAPGKRRSNPFDSGIRRSYDEKFYVTSDDRPDGRWLRFVVDPENLSRVYGQIRNAAQSQNLGSNVDHAPELDEHDQPTGREVVFFRGKPREPREPRSDDSGVGDDVANDTTDEDYDEE